MSEGRLNRRKLARLGHELSGLLRHRAPSAGITMDAAGWVQIEDVLRALGVTRAILDELVVRNEKARYEIADGRIRACQGHSFAEMPVTREALEESWDVWNSRESIWHGTSAEALSAIGREGILPGDRTHVHMAQTLGSKVRKRARVEVMIEINPERLRAQGITVYRSSNGVLLARRVPRSCIVGVRVVDATVRQKEGELMVVLGLRE